MNQLPNEIIFSILQYIPQRYRSILPTVCKQWHTILLQPLFFNTIHMYSDQQLVKFIKMAKKKTLGKSNEPISHYVVHIHFYTYRITKRKDLIYLVKHCPNLQTLKGLEINYPLSIRPDNLFPSLKNLQHFFYWYGQYDNEQWMTQFLNNQHKIKTLELYLHRPCFHLNPSNSSSTSTSTSVLTSTSTSPLSVTSFIYFTPNGSLQQQSIFDGESYFLSFQEYRIHVIKLPFLPALTRLTLFIYRNGDEHIMETIHQSCPNLFSLKLTYFKMHISEEYIRNMKWNQQQQQLFLKPHSSLKELYISNQLYDPKCYDYLSFKYPHLESLSLDIGVRHCPNEFITAFKSSIYNMITRYKYLKKLKVGLGGGNFVTQVWPHAELLGWLQRNPTQLTHLDYRYDCSKKILEKDISDDYNNLNQQQVYYNMIPSSLSPLSSSTTTTTSTPSKNDEPIPFFQYHNYLNHLSSLTLHKPIGELDDVLCGFFLYNDNNNNNERSMIVSNSITELNLENINCNIYFWLDVFPNLKSFKICGSCSVKDEDDNDDEEKEKKPSLENKEIYSSIRSQMKRKEQQRQQTLNFSKDLTSTVLTTNITTTATNTTHFYKLKKIEMVYCNNVEFKKFGWNGFFKLCPDLKTIILNKINEISYVHYKEDEIHAVEQCTFDLSHLSLDHLEIYRFNDAPYKHRLGRRSHFVKELMIHETSLGKTYFVGPNNVSQDESFNYECSTTLNIICKCIDSLIFDNTENNN